MASQQPPGESKTINILTKKCANGFTAASRIIHISTKQIRKWLHNSLLENQKPQIFKNKNSQMASQQPHGESKTINI